MGNMQERVDRPIDKVEGPLPGEKLLKELKQSMVKQRIFRAMFGEKGERIFIDKLPSLNDTIVPLIDFYWQRDVFGNADTYLTGSISGRFILPAMLEGDYNGLRRVASIFQRWLGSDQHGLFDAAPGLIEFGLESSFDYNQLLQATGGTFPIISFVLPFRFDMHLFQLKHPEFDFSADLDAEELPWLETYGIEVLTEESQVIIAEGTLSQTGMTNDDG